MATSAFVSSKTRPASAVSATSNSISVRDLNSTDGKMLAAMSKATGICIESDADLALARHKIKLDFTAKLFDLLTGGKGDCASFKLLNGVTSMADAGLDLSGGLSGIGNSFLSDITKSVEFLQSKFDIATEIKNICNASDISELAGNLDLEKKLLTMIGLIERVIGLNDSSLLEALLQCPENMTKMAASQITDTVRKITDLGNIKMLKVFLDVSSIDPRKVSNLLDNLRTLASNGEQDDESVTAYNDILTDNGLTTDDLVVEEATGLDGSTVYSVESLQQVSASGTALIDANVDTDIQLQANAVGKILESSRVSEPATIRGTWVDSEGVRHVSPGSSSPALEAQAYLDTKSRLATRTKPIVRAVPTYQHVPKKSDLIAPTPAVLVVGGCDCNN